MEWMSNLLVLALDTKESFLRALVPARVNLAPGRCVGDGPELMVFDTHNGVCSIGDMLPQIVNEPLGAIFNRVASQELHLVMVVAAKATLRGLGNQTKPSGQLHSQRSRRSALQSTTYSQHARRAH